MAKAAQMLAWDTTSILWATIANAHRDAKTRRKPFNPAEIHPFRDESDFGGGGKEEPDWATIAQIRRQYKRTVLHGSQSGRSVS